MKTQKAINIPFSAIIYARQKGASKATSIRLFYLIKSRLADSRGEFQKNNCELARLAHLSREYVSNIFKKMLDWGFLIPHQEKDRYIAIGQKKVSKLCMELIGGMETYRSNASPNKICKLAPTLLDEGSTAFRQILDTALLLEEESVQARAISCRQRKYKQDRRQKSNDLLLSDGDSPNFDDPVLSCKNAGKRFGVDPSTICRRLKKLEAATWVDRQRQEKILFFEEKSIASKAITYLPPPCYYSSARQAVILPMPSSFSVIHSCGIEWVRRKLG